MARLDDLPPTSRAVGDADGVAGAGPGSDEDETRWKRAERKREAAEAERRGAERRREAAEQRREVSEQQREVDEEGRLSAELERRLAEAPRLGREAIHQPLDTLPLAVHGALEGTVAPVTRPLVGAPGGDGADARRARSCAAHRAQLARRVRAP